MARKAKIDQYHVALFGEFLQKLKSTPDGEGSLLDHSMILYGGGLGNGNLHDHVNLPVLVAGRGAGALQGGVHNTYPDNTPMANLSLSMLDKAGVPTPEKTGDSTEHLGQIRQHEAISTGLCLSKCSSCLICGFVRQIDTSFLKPVKLP